MRNDIILFVILAFTILGFCLYYQANIYVVVSAMVILNGLALLHATFVNKTPRESEALEKKVADEIRKKRVNDYAGDYPNGWYLVCHSAELKIGKIIEFTAFGQIFLAYRGEDGLARVMDAYCPHLGANLAVGGNVKGNCIECPFHKWTFSGDTGSVTYIPYCEDTPTSIKAKTYQSIEYNQILLFWWHADKIDPTYFPEPVGDIEEGKLTYRGKYDQNVKMHVQEFAENSADFQHFPPLHGKMMIPWTTITIPSIFGLTLLHRADWKQEVDTSKPHICYFYDFACLKFWGKTIKSTETNAVITFIGPALVHFTFFIPNLGKIVVYQTHLPLEPMLQKVRFFYFADRSIPNLLVSYIVGSWISQWQNDISIWENKTCKIKPGLVKNDGPIMQNRRWFNQFYSESSRRKLINNL